MIRLPKGTKDYDGEDYLKLEYLKNIISNLFKKYNGKFIETPVFELTGVLTSKYGEEEKLIYNIESSDDTVLTTDESNKKDVMFKEILSLRYDHTVPLVRYCILNKIDKMRRCCVGKVYRRETTTKSQIRLREFYQADFDYVGTYDNLVPELEIFMMIQEFMKKMDIQNYEIIYNYRQNLEYYIREAGMDPDNLNTICSSVDKLDKKSPEDVRVELVEKGCTDGQIDKLFKLLFGDDALSPNVQDIDRRFRELLGYIDFLDMSKVIFSPSLARGLDYYTGIIFEVKLTSTNMASSVCGGGRYDKLIPSYKPNAKPDEIFPMIGLTFGIDRLLPFVKLPRDDRRAFKIWVATIGQFDNPNKIKLDIVGNLIRDGYSVYYNLSKRKFTKEIRDANKNECNYVVIVGEKEWKLMMVSVKNMKNGEQKSVTRYGLDDYFREKYVKL